MATARLAAGLADRDVRLKLRLVCYSLPPEMAAETDDVSGLKTCHFSRSGDWVNLRSQVIAGVELSCQSI